MSDLLIENINVYHKFIKKNNLFESAQINLIQSGGSGDTNTDPFYSENVEKLTKQNNDYRRVLYTGQNQQFVLMSILPKDNIHMEIHESHDQFVRIEQGEGEATIGSNTYKLQDNTAFIVPAGVSHKITNTSETESLKLYTIYSPPEHPDKLVQKTNPNKQTGETESNKLIPNNKINLTNIDLYSESEQLDKYVSREILEKELKNNIEQTDSVKVGRNRILKNNHINYDDKYTNYKNKYITLKKFISKYYQ